MPSDNSAENPIDQLVDQALEAAAQADVDPVRRAELIRSAREFLAHSHNGATPRAPTPTDDDLAGRWLKQHPLTAWGLGEFRRYHAGIWPVVPVDAVRAELMAVLEIAKAEGVRPSARLLASVLELARIEIALSAEQWDANVDLVATLNGALRISERKLEPPAPEHHLTAALPFDYDLGAPARTWRWFLETTVPAAADFLQEFAGLCLTTSTRYELAVWLNGQPGSGRSTFLSGLQTMLGPRAGLLGLADVERSRFALTELPGKTLVVSTEQPGDYITAGHILNALISGEPLTVDRKFKDPVTIIPQVKLAWAMNSLPRVSESSSGLFRRVRVVEFPPRPEAERLPSVKENIAKEGPGILNWALDGLARLNQRGRFAVPADVQTATDNFRLANDIPAQFVAECCVVGAAYKVKGGALYQAYRKWCIDTGHKPQSMTSLADDWERLGYERHEAAGNFWRLGIGLKADE